MFRQAQLTLRHRLNHLLGLFGQTLRHPLGLLWTESLKLIKERHLLDFLLGIFFDLGVLARDLRLVNFRFALDGEIRAGTHRQRRGYHSGETGDENEMLLIVCCAGDARDDPKYRAKSIVHTIDCVRHPTASAPMPALT